MTLSDAALTRCINTVRERMAIIPPTPNDLRVIIEQNAKLVEALSSYEGPADRNSDLDTYEREWVIDIVAATFTACEVPTNSTPKAEVKAFVEDLVRNAQKQGWRIAG